MIKLMKAQKIRDEEIWTDHNWIAEDKIDGKRLQVECTEVGDNRLWSSLENDWSKEPGLEWLRTWRLPKGMHLDGELAVPFGSSNITNEDVDSLVYDLFDVMHDGKSLVIEKPLVDWRRKLLEEIVVGAPGRVKLVGFCSNGKRDFFDEILRAGGEGVILKRSDAPYQPGKRSWDWQKAKRMLNVNVMITGCNADPTLWTVKPGKVGTDGILYPDGKPSESAKLGYRNLQYGYLGDDMKLVTVGSLGFTGPRDVLADYVGRVVSVDCWGVYDTGCLRHPGMVGVNKEKKLVFLSDIISQAGTGVIKTKRKGEEKK